MQPLESLVAVVTGGGRGIGRTYCERLAAYGAQVVVNDAGVSTTGEETAETPADEVVAAIKAAGGNAVVHTGDVSLMATGRELLACALDTWGRLDIVVANAGFGRPRMAFNLDEPDWDAVIGVHLKGTFAVAQPALQHWRAQAKASGVPSNGRLITTATGLLVYGGAGQSNYVAAKAGVLAFTESVATEMAPYGATANTIMPGANTRLAQIGWRMSRSIDNVSIGRRVAPAGGPDDSGSADVARDDEWDPRDPVHVAEFGCYLASPAAGWISGQTFQTRGGHIEHVQTFVVDSALARSDRGWTLADLDSEMPRLFGAGARRADPPPPTWKKPSG